MRQRGAPTPHLLPRCSAPLRTSPGGGGRARTAPGAHHAPGTAVTARPSLSRPGVPTPGTAHKRPAGSSEPPWSRQVPAAPGGRAGAHLPAPTCRGGSGAGARPRRCCGCERGRGERAEAAGHRRPRRQRTCQLLWKTAGRKAALLAAPGSGASAAWAPASQHSPPRRRQLGVAQVGWSRRGLLRRHTACPDTVPSTASGLPACTPTPATTGTAGPRVS